MSKKNFLFQKTTEQPEKLFDFLKEKLFFEKKIRFSDTQFKQYIAKGFIKIDDVIQKDPNKKILKNQYLSAIVLIHDIKKAQRPPLVEFNFKEDMILFEDDCLIVVNKPHGIPTHSTFDPDRDHLVAGIKRFLLARDKKNPYLGLHHRLDKDTSGVVLFTKRQDVNKAVGDLFAKRKIEKIYLAVTFCQNIKSDSWKVENKLARSTQDKRLIIPVKDGDLALTHFELLHKNEKYALIQAEPYTGRTHQIRVHLNGLGLSILGDILYRNDHSENFDRLYLHAHSLQFRHPKSNMILEIESPMPESFKKFFPELEE